MGLASILLLTLAAIAGPEPYGGCDEAWQAPASPGAFTCTLIGAATATS